MALALGGPNTADPGPPVASRCSRPLRYGGGAAVGEKGAALNCLRSSALLALSHPPLDSCLTGYPPPPHPHHTPHICAQVYHLRAQLPAKLPAQRTHTQPPVATVTGCSVAGAASAWRPGGTPCHAPVLPLQSAPCWVPHTARGRLHKQGVLLTVGVLGRGCGWGGWVGHCHRVTKGRLRSARGGRRG